MATKRKAGEYNPYLLPNTCQTPNVILDHWMATLSDVEFRLVMYAVRHTYGWQKESDQISVAQFVNGIKDKNGEVVDRGTGKTRSSVQRGLKSLVGKGILDKQERKAEDGGDLPPGYSLNLQYLPPVEDQNIATQTGPEGGPHNEARGGSQNAPRGGRTMRPGGAASEGSGGPHNEAHKTQVSQNPTIQNPEDLPSVDLSVSARDTLTPESNPEGREAEPNDRPTDRQIEENTLTNEPETYATTTLSEREDPHHEQSNAEILSPKEDEDNASLKPEEALRQRAETISLSEVTEEAMCLVRKVVNGLPSLEERDYRRVKRLAEHYQRQDRAVVFSSAASGLVLEAQRRKIRHPYSYLLACCVDTEHEFSEEDEAPLRSLSGENASSPSEESQPAGYEWFFNDNEVEENTNKGEHRQQSPNADPEALEVWEKILEDVSGEINAPSLRVWFEGTVPISLSNDTLTVSVPNSFAKEYIESRFKELLEGALAKRLSPTSSLEITVGVEDSGEET